MALRVTLDLYARASGLVAKNRPRGRNYYLLLYDIGFIPETEDSAATRTREEGETARGGAAPGGPTLWASICSRCQKITTFEIKGTYNMHSNRQRRNIYSNLVT